MRIFNTIAWRFHPQYEQILHINYNMILYRMIRFITNRAISRETWGISKHFNWNTWLIPSVFIYTYLPVRGKTIALHNMHNVIQNTYTYATYTTFIIVHWWEYRANKWYLLNTCIIVSIFRFSKSVKRSDHSGTDDKNEGQWWVYCSTGDGIRVRKHS